jgi:hypothetical protein
MKGILIATLFIITSELVAQNITLNVKNLQCDDGLISDVVYKGKTAVRLSGKDGNSAIAVVPMLKLKNAIIECDLAGTTLETANNTARGFIGIAFRVNTTDSLRYECFYLRPTNGRADDQLRRNHSVQYISHPKFPWFKLRKENPGVYESYTDLVEAEWTKIKIVVKDSSAKLFVNGAPQPCLIVNDLKLGIQEGGIALWSGDGTDGYFSNLRITVDK